MLFSVRKKIEDEYYKYLESINIDHGIGAEDCPFNVITFLDKCNLLDNDAVSDFLCKLEVKK
jgi:hypothetical protein